MPTKQEYSTLVITNNLEKKIKIEIDKISDIFDKLTDVRYKKNIKLDKQNFLKTQKKSKFKNYLIKIFTFGCYDKNKILRQKLHQNKIKLDLLIAKENDLAIKYETANLLKNKLISDLTKIKTNSQDKEFIVSNLLMDKINSQIQEHSTQKLFI